MLKRKPNRQDNNVSEPEKPAVFFERMEPKILLSADALSGLVTSDPFNEDAANAGLDISASVDLLKTSYQVSDSNADSSKTASGEDLSDQSSVLGLIGDSHEGDDTSIEALSSVLNDGNSGSATRQEIIFVDAATPDYQELLSGIDTDAADTDYQIFILQSDRDGVEQITGILGRFDTVDAVHLVGHGNEQGIQLGDSWLGQNNLADYAESLGAWSNTLSTEADILIYGCNLAADNSGRQFINELANITEADVAASDDLTGNKLLGGDWDLEFTVGEVETQLAFNYQLQQQWDGTLLVLESFEPAAADMADNAYEVKSDTSYGQTFSYDSGVGTYVVNSLEVVLYKDPAASLQTITVSLRDSYDGTVLGSNTISSADLTTTEDWYSFDIGTAILNDNTTYVIQVENDGIEKVYLGVDDTSSYSNGDLLNDGGVAVPGKDAAFKVIHNGTGNYLDDFNAVSYNNSSGSLDWSPENWIEFGDDGNAASGEIHISGNSLVLEHWGGLGHEVYRNVDLTGAAKATLAFDYTITGDLVNGGVVEVLAWDGFGDNVVATYDLSASVGTTSASLDISAYANEYSAVTFRILAGGAGTNAIFTVDDVNVFASEGSNYAPVATNMDSTSNYNEGDPVVPIEDIIIKDADINDIVTATLTLADTSTGSLSPNNGATYDPGTGVWTITDTIDNVNLALATLEFNPVFTNTLDTKISVVIDDGDEDASGPLTGVINLIVTPVNDAPVLDLDADNSSASGVDYKTTFVEFGGPVNITDSDVLLSDIDDTNLVSITVTLTNEQEPGDEETLFANAGATGLTVNWDSGTNVLTISGAGTIADYKSVLSTVTYDNTRTNPNTTDRVITFVADDGTDTSVIATTFVSVVNVDKAPVANDDAFIVDEGSTNTINLAGNDADQDGDLEPDSIAIVSGPVNGTITAINSDGTVEYVHDGSETVADSFTYTILDNSGAVSNTATVNLVVTPVNDAPVANNDAFTVNEGSTTNLDLVGNDSDVDGAVNPASIVITGAPTNGSIVINANGTVDYTHDGSETVADSFTYTILDNSSAVSNTATVNLVVTPVNDAPTTTPVTLTVIGEDSGARLITQAELLSNASDVDGDPLNANGLSIASGSGTLVDNGDGTWSYTPAADDDTSVSFSYTVTDGSLTAVGSASLDITPVNDAPVAISDAFTVNEGSATNLNLVGNDSDIDGVVNPASIVISGIPTNGSIVVNTNGTVDYTHDGSETVADSFTYTILDNSGVVSNTATVNLVVTPVNDVPVATNDAFTVNEGSTANLDLAGNDTDVEGAVNPASIVITGSPTNGSVVVKGDGSVDYTHDGSETVADSFTYTIQDNNGAVSNSATVNMTVTPVNDAPVAHNDVFTVNEGSTTTLNLAINDTDVDGTVDLTSIVITDAPTNGSIAVNDDGTVDYTHDGSAALADSFSYTILDNSGTVSNTGTINLSVMPAAVIEVIVATETKEDSGTADTSNTEGTSTNIEDTSSTGDEEKPGEAAVDEGALNATDELVFDASTFTGGIGARNVLTIPALFEVDIEQGDRSTIIIRDNDTSTVRKLDITVIDRLREQFTGYDGPLQMVTTDSFISKLDDVREEIVLENNTFDMVVGGSMSMSAGISVGYAIWLARSGVLMSGLLSSMPAWAFIDPLPVLASMGTKDNEEDEEDESLESMVEEKEDDKQDDKQEDN